MATKTEMYQVACPNCGKDVDIIPPSAWNPLVKMYVPACPYCAHSFKTHIRNKRDLAEYIKYPFENIEDDEEEEEPVKEGEW